MIDDGVFLPNFLATCRIDRDQPAIEGADKDFSLVERDATVDDVAASLVADLARDFGVIGPDFLARAYVDCVHHAPRRRDIHDAVDDERRRLDATHRFEIVGPREAEILHVVGIDLAQLAEAGFGIIEAIT